MNLARSRSRLWLALALISSAWLIFHFVNRYILGPLTPDEVYFSHTLWLTIHGKSQYVDFYSHHLPTYFWLYGALLPRMPADDLTFVWLVRLSNILVVLGYAGLLFWADRRRAIFLLPLLLAMIVVSRMIEIRSDTPGLLLFNAAWVVLLRRYSRPAMVVSAALALFGALFSARGLVMCAGFAVALIYVVLAKRDVRALFMLCAFGAAAALAGLVFYIAEPAYVTLLVNEALLDPATILIHLSFAQRILAFDRLPQTLLMIAALAIAVACLVKRRDEYRSAIIAIACFAQLLLILFDPSPFPYVYAWSMLPALLGLALVEHLAPVDARPLAAAGGAALATGLAGLTISYPLVTGHAAPTGSNYRLLPDPPIDMAVVRRLPNQDLVALMLSGKDQHSLANQLAIRRELCRRIRGPVHSVWQTHPVCMPDASYYWNEIKWPNIWADGPAPKSVPWFEAIFRDTPPALVIWKVRPDDRTPLNAWAKGLLRDYDAGPGFALRRRTGQIASVGQPAG